MKDRNKRRAYVLSSLIVILSSIFLLKLFSIQVVDSKYKDIASKIAMKQVKLYPNRGLIYDRNKELLVYNQAIYDILVVPRQVKDLDTTLLCEILDISKASFDERMAQASKDLHFYSTNEFYKQLPAEKYALFLEHSYKFEGFFGETRTIRKYTYPGAAHILGDVGEVDSSDIKASDYYYQPRDYAGKSGLEKVYDKELRGSRGYKFVFIDKYNKEQGSFNLGNQDSMPTQGANLATTIDIKLQMYGELLLQNKIGSVVAIEPSTGEVLALVSSPNFDPNLLCGSSRGKNYSLLEANKLNPLFNRAVMAQYPPGSTFKPVTAAIAMQEGAINQNFSYYCNTIYSIPGYTLHCSHNHPPALNVQEGLQHSCNPYFWQTFRNTLDSEKYKTTLESYGAWYAYTQKFGLGQKLGIDMLSEKSGNIPSVDYYNKLYGNGRWRALTIISLAIGQGEILLTPLQLANLYAVFANRGYYIRPHLVKNINGENIDDLKRIETGIDKEYFEVIAEGLQLVVDAGTGRRSKIPNINFGGKTGTAQNPHGEDHSIFAGFAPVENPKISISVVVENGGGGSKYAAPIASLMVEMYLHDTIATSRLALEQSILDANLIDPEEEKED
ncbi:MAG: penicillin-binding protein 2 [Chitinophagales bacterium]|nr:penicillin-binding protein 2 [Chitinophagales bacterium]